MLEIGNRSENIILFVVEKVRRFVFIICVVVLRIDLVVSHCLVDGVGGATK